MARNHEVDSDFDLPSAACPPTSAEGIHFNIVNSASTNLEHNRFDNNLSANASRESRSVLAAQTSSTRTVSPTDNVSANVVEPNACDSNWSTRTNGGDDQAERSLNELDNSHANANGDHNENESDDGEDGNELDGALLFAMQDADALMHSGQESETSDDNNERERVFHVTRLKNLRALDANLDFGELEDRRAPVACTSTSGAPCSSSAGATNGHAFATATPQFGSAFWTSRARRAQPCNGVDRHPRARVCCSHASHSLNRVHSEPSSVTEDFIDESCESTSLSVASENTDAAHSESSNDDTHAAPVAPDVERKDSHTRARPNVSCAACAALSHPCSNSTWRCFQLTAACASCATLPARPQANNDGRRSSRKRPRRSAAAAAAAAACAVVPAKDADSDADDEDERDAEADADQDADTEQLDRPLDQRDTLATVRQNDLNSSANAEAAAMQNDLSDTRPSPAAALDTLGGATTRPKALGRRSTVTSERERPATSPATEADECDSNVMSPSQLMDALRCVTDSPDASGPVPQHVRRATSPNSRSKCTCECASHPLNVTKRDFLAPLANGHSCDCGANCHKNELYGYGYGSDHSCTRLATARHERRSAFACALHGAANGSSEPSSSGAGTRLACISSANSVGASTSVSTDATTTDTTHAQSSLATSESGTHGESERRAETRPKPNAAAIVSEKVLIWSEYEAYISQVKQVGASACGPTAVINVLKSFDLLEFCDDKRRVEAYIRTHRRAERGTLVEYLRSRSCAGTTAQQLVAGVRRLTRGRVEARFFATFPERRFALSAWLATWMRRGATPLATLNLQRAVPPGYAVPDAWHHQMVFGVGPKGIYLTNPLETVPETVIRQQLASDSVLLVRKSDVFARWHAQSHDRAPECDLSDLLDTPIFDSDSEACVDSDADADDSPSAPTLNGEGDESETENSHAHERRASASSNDDSDVDCGAPCLDLERPATRRKPPRSSCAAGAPPRPCCIDTRWREMNVLGQVVHTLRTAHAPGFTGFQPEYAHHVCIPAAYRAGITLFVRADNVEALEALRSEPELPLLYDAAPTPTHTTN